MPGSTRRRLTLALGAFSLAGLLAVPAVWRYLQNQAQGWVLIIGAPLRSLGETTKTLLTGPQLVQEIDRLRQEVAMERSRAAELSTVLRENEELRTLTQLPPSPQFASQGVEVIGRLENESGVSYLVNRGSADGLVPGLALVAGFTNQANRVSALMVGTLTKVTSHTSQFILTTASQSQVLAEIINSNRSHALAVGEYNLGLQLKFIPATEELAPGHIVVTSGLDSLVPAGLLVGTITQVQKNEGDFFLSATVAPPMVLDRFHVLQVLKPTK